MRKILIVSGHFHLGDIETFIPVSIQTLLVTETVLEHQKSHCKQHSLSDDFQYNKILFRDQTTVTLTGCPVTNRACSILHQLGHGGVLAGAEDGADGVAGRRPGAAGQAAHAQDPAHLEGSGERFSRVHFKIFLRGFFRLRFFKVSLSCEINDVDLVEFYPRFLRIALSSSWCYALIF